MKHIVFADFITLQRGFDLPRSMRIAGDFPVIGASDYQGTHAEAKVQGPIVTTGRSGTIGAVLYTNSAAWPLNTCLWVKDFKGNNPYYVYCVLKTLNLAQYNAGAGVPTLNRNHLDGIQLRIHERREQDCIASILSAYDDFIENNTRRIAILEEMARRIFEEWFVHFRAPACEGLPFVDSAIGPVPQGWEIVPLETLCSRVTDGAHHSPPTVTSGCPMLSVKDMRTWGFEFSECRSISQADFDVLVHNNCRPVKGDVLVAKDGANLNKHTFLIEDDMNAVILSSIEILRPVPSIEKEFFLATLKSEDVSRRIKSSRSGAAIPRIILKDFRRLPLLLPPVGLRKRFETIEEPIHKMCRVLSRSNTNLHSQRDLLLPKLISGEIDVGAASTSLMEAAE